MSERISPQLSDSALSSFTPEKGSFSFQLSMGKGTVFPSLALQGYLLRGDDVIVMTEIKPKSVEGWSVKNTHLLQKFSWEKKKNCRSLLALKKTKKDCRMDIVYSSLPSTEAGIYCPLNNFTHLLLSLYYIQYFPQRQGL